MGITEFRALSTVLCFIALIGVFIWTYHPNRKTKYDEAARAPFSDDVDEANEQSAYNRENH